MLPEQLSVAQCEERNRKHSHAGPVAGVPFIEGGFQDTFQHVISDAATTGIADIHRFRTEPCGKFFGNGLQRPTFFRGNRSGNA